MIQVTSELLHESYYEEVLPSGFRIILYPKQDIYNKGAFLSVGYGGLIRSFVDASGKTHHTPAGTAHFLEHKLFENDQVKIIEQMSQLGANVNAFTALENTCYYFTGPDRFDEALDLLLQLPIVRAYTDDGVKSERDIIGREIDMYLDSIDYRSYRNALAALYPKHPIGEDIAGTLESIEEIDRETLDLVMDQFYVPENMFLFLIGDFLPEDMTRFIDQLPEFYQTYRPKAEVILPKDTTKPKRKTLVEYDDAPLASFDYLLKLEPIDDPVLAFRRYIKYNLILDVLFGKGSDFFEDNYTSGVLSDLDVEYHYGQGYRYLSFSGEGKKPNAFKKKLEELLGRFHLEGVSVEEVDRIKRKTMGRYLMGFNSINNIAQTFIAFHYLKVNLFDYLEIIREIHLDDFQDLFQGTPLFSVIKKEKP